MGIVRIDFHLSPRELEQLAQAASDDRRPEVRRRAKALWHLHHGVTVAAVARMVEVRARRTIYHWYERYREHGIEGLADVRRPGRMPKAGPEYRQLLEAALAQAPTSLGYRQQSWTVPLLQSHMTRVTGITLSDCRLRALLKSMGYAFEVERAIPMAVVKSPKTPEEVKAWIELSSTLDVWRSTRRKWTKAITF